ncbi:MAG: protein disulfide oxidoreductase [Gammaproteobacteria bacterium]|nr:protein disulfide oxidoreductase [Gammaproteobacteria bacterium]
MGLKEIKPRLKSGLSTFIIFSVVIVLANYWTTRNHLVGIAPAFEVYNLQGELVSFDFKEAKKPKLLHFFATWCPICELENASLNNLSADYEVIMIAIKSGSSAEVMQYKKEHGLEMTVYNDEYGEVSNQYSVVGVPASFIINNQGQIVSSTVGYVTEIGLRLRLWFSQ